MPTGQLRATRATEWPRYGPLFALSVRRVVWREICAAVSHGGLATENTENTEQEVFVISVFSVADSHCASVAISTRGTS